MSKWTQTQGYNTATRLGELAIRTQQLILRQKVASLRAIIDAHTREVRAHPKGASTLERVRRDLDLADREETTK